jgi:hypothetical protein
MEQEINEDHNIYFPRMCSCGKELNCCKVDIKFRGKTVDLGGVDWFDCISCKTTFACVRSKYLKKENKDGEIYLV